jgi:fructoselysine-6-phosphate deglycase
MLKFDEQKQIDSVNGALALRPEIEKIVDEICEKGYDRIVYVGIGGTWASAMQAEYHANELSDLPLYSLNAAVYNTCGDKRITKDSVIVLSSVSGNTSCAGMGCVGCTSPLLMSSHSRASPFCSSRYCTSS